MIRAQAVQRVLVTGGTGVLGRRLLPALAACGHEVHALVRSAEAAAAVAALGAAPVRGDVLDGAGVRAAVREVRPDVVVHQATALSAPGGLATTTRMRREGTAHLMRAAEAAGVQRMVAQSLAMAYSHAGPGALTEEAPLDRAAPPAWQAAVDGVAALEDTVLGSAAVVGVALRYGALYGPGTFYAPDGLVARRLRARRLPLAGRGAGRTSFVHLDDAVAATLDAVERGFGVYNVADDVPAPAREWMPHLAAAVGAPPPRRLPAWLARRAIGAQAVRQMTTQRGISSRRARDELGWRPEYADWRTALGR